MALGSNVPHPQIGGPRAVITAALNEMSAAGLTPEAVSRVIDSAALGPSRRRYANAAALVSTTLDPEHALTALQTIERAFGRRRRGMRWGARVLDLDLVLWSGGPWVSERLIIPHPRFGERRFVLGPAAEIAPGWRDPVSGRTLRQLMLRALRATPRDA